MKILVTGSNGQLGNCLKTLSAQHTAHQFVFMDRDGFSLTDPVMMDKVLEAEMPAIVFNCAAYTAVDKAEHEAEMAFAVNASGPGQLAYLCNQKNIRLIHISTDYVFDGLSKKPYTEEDQANPIGVYGKSKLLGEQNVLQSNPEALIIRTSWVFSPFGKNFVKTMINLMHSRDSISVVNDQYGRPTYAMDLGAALINIAEKKAWLPGVYHFCNAGSITWFEFAGEIARQIHSKCAIRPISTAEFPTPAKRPAYSVLNTEKISETFDLDLPGWKDGLVDCIERINSIKN